MLRLLVIHWSVYRFSSRIQYAFKTCTNAKMWNISIREFVYFRIGRKSTYFSWGLVFIAYCLKQKVYVTSRDFRAYPDFTLWLFSRFWPWKWKKWLECAWNFSNTLTTPWKQFTATVKYYTKQNAQNQSLEQIHGVKRSRCEIISRRKIVTPFYYKASLWIKSLYSISKSSICYKECANYHKHYWSEIAAIGFKYLMLSML